MRRKRQRQFWMVILGLLAGQALAIPPETAPQIELSCLVRNEPGTSLPENLWLEIRSPAGEIIRDAGVRPGHTVRFKDLSPGILVACVEDSYGGRRCRSVDLYPPPGSRRACFSVDLQPPAWSPEATQQLVVSKTNLAIPGNARREFESCLNERRAGRPEKAAAHLGRALEIHPDYPEALSNLGTLHFQAHDFGRALGLFERVTQIAPQLHAGWLNLGSVLLEIGETGSALQASNRALALRPDDPFVLYQVGLCHYKLGRLAEARQYLERAVHLDPASATYPQLCLASIALKEQHEEEAEGLLRQLLELHPYSPQPPAMQVLMKQLSLSRD